MKIFKLTIAIGAALALLLAACGRDSDDEDGSTATTDPSFCAEQTLEATEIGVSETKITILVMADVGFALAPGLFQGSIDGTKAWANYVNANGGLACRQIEVIEHDSALNSIETTNGFLRACDDALALVGSSSLSATNVDALNKCEDSAGNAIGIPDYAERAVESPHACSSNVFTIAGINRTCPYVGDGVSSWSINIGIDKYLVNTYGDDLHGVFAIPADLPSTQQSSMPAIRAASRISGIYNDGEVGVSGLDAQAKYGQLLTIMRTNDSNFGRTGSNDDSLLKWRREAEAQGGFEDVIWSCSLACHTTSFRNDSASEGTYIWTNFLPFDEKEHNEELNTFITAIGTDNPPSWAAGAWAEGRLFEQVVNEVVAEYGVNGITRARLLEFSRQVTNFDANGMFGDIDLSTTPSTSDCIVVLKVVNKEFVRQWPEEPGTFDCSEDNVVTIELDAAEEYANGPSEEDKRPGS